jgi:hypothetical protein
MADQINPLTPQILASAVPVWPVRKCKTCKWQAVFEPSTGLGNGKDTVCIEGKMIVTPVPHNIKVIPGNPPSLEVINSRNVVCMTPAPNEYGCSKWAPRFSDATGTGPAN